MATIDPFGIEPVSHLRALDADAVALEKAIREANQLPRDFPKEDMLTLCLATREAVRADDEDRPVLLQALHEQLVMMRRNLPREGDEETDEPSHQHLRNALNELSGEVFECLLDQALQPDPVQPEDDRLGPATEGAEEIQSVSQSLPQQGNEAITQIQGALGYKAQNIEFNLIKIVISGKAVARILDVAINGVDTLAKRIGQLAKVLISLPGKMHVCLKAIGETLSFAGEALGIFSETATKLGVLCVTYSESKMPGGATDNRDPDAQLRLIESYLKSGHADLAREAAEALKMIPGHKTAQAAFTFQISGQENVEDVSALATLTYLQSLDLSDTGVRDVTALSALVGLQSLSLAGTEVCDVTALSGLSNLQTLDLAGTKVSDVTPLSRCMSLSSLSLERSEVHNVNALSGCKKLRSLNLALTDISDITALSSLTNLQFLYLGGTDVEDLSPLSALERLRTLDLKDSRTLVTPVVVNGESTWRVDSRVSKITDVSMLSGLANLIDLTLPYGVEDNRTKKPESG